MPSIYVMVDLEGISGIYSNEQLTPDGIRFGEGKRFVTAEVNACVSALKAAGAGRVYVRDVHGGSYSLIYDELSGDADAYILGESGDCRYPMMEECDGVILLGYHAMAGTPGAILEHSMMSTKIQNYDINGIRVGEVGIDAGGVGDFGKPVILVTGDDRVCAEAKALLPWTETVCVKRALSVYGGAMLPQKKAHEAIAEGVKRAMARMDEMKPYVFAKPVRLRVEMIERGPLPGTHAKPYMTVLDGRTYEVTGDSVMEAFNRSL